MPAQQVADNGQLAQVILGADDKHLAFRTCVAVRVADVGEVVISLGTRVRCNNLFGRFYMAMINRVHRRYVTPTMLRPAVEHALAWAAPHEAIDNMAMVAK